MAEQFDAIVIGTGTAGEVAISRLLRQGMRVALVERELIGGECAYWACMPSKTLLRPPETRAEARRAAGIGEPAQRWPEIAAYRDWMIRVEAGDRQLAAERIILANGSEAAIPPIEGLAEAGYWTNREATTTHDVPDSIVVVGGGPAGIELGQFFARMGSAVTLVEAMERLLGREDTALSPLAADALRADDRSASVCRSSASSTATGGAS